MMIRHTLIAILLHIAEMINGQVDLKHFLSPQQVTDLRNSLTKDINDTIRIGILMRLAKFHFDNGNNEKIFLDSARLFIHSAKKINLSETAGKWKGLILLYEGSLARRGGDQNSGRLLISKAIRILRRSNDQFHLAEAYLELSCCYDQHDLHQIPAIKKVYNSLFGVVPAAINRSERDSCMSLLMNHYLLKMQYDRDEVKLDFMIHLARSYQIVDDKIHELWSRKEVSDLRYKVGQLNIAIKELLEVAKEQEEGNYPGLCFTYDLLSGLYYAGADNKKAIYYSLESIKQVKTASDSVYLVVFYHRVAATYSQTGSFAEAADWNRKAVNHLISQNQIDGIYSYMYDLTINMIKLKKPAEAIEMILAKRKLYPPEVNWEKHYMFLSLAECYVALKNYSRAEQYCDELIKLHEARLKQGETLNSVILYQFLANFYLAAGKYRKSEMYFKYTMNEWPKSGADLGVLYKNKYLFKLDSAKGNYISAIRNLQNYHLIKDSISTAVKTKQIDEIKIAYQTEQKDSLIGFKEQNIQLLTRQDELQKIKLQQGTLLRNISLGVAALLIIVIALLFNRYRLKQRSTTRLELQRSEITKQNYSLSQLVKEKDWLVKEIHHRVKNNFQTVMGLLGTQSSYLKSEDAVNAIYDSRHRIQSMSLIHQRLYQSNNLSAINMYDYIHELVDSLNESFNTRNHIRTHLEIETMELDLAHCIPLGLIMNEAITNAFKYAFPGGAPGTITILFKKVSATRLQLTIQDNGRGLSSSFNINKCASMGMNLMRGLSEEIDAQFQIGGDPGTQITVSFEYNPEFEKDMPPVNDDKAAIK